MNDLVSVIIPVWNSKQLLPESIENIMAQSYSPLEVIYVDDESSDGSAEQLDAYAKTYPIRILHKSHGGAAAARNFGVQHARGKWIVFVDVDDKCAKHMIERLVSACNEHSCSIACCDVARDLSELSADAGVLSEVEVFNHETAVKMLFEERILSFLHSKIFSRTLFEHGLMQPEGMTFEDLYIMPEIFMQSDGGVAVIREKLYYYWQNRSGSVSNTHSEKHSVDLSVAQRHRFDLANEIPGFPDETLALLLYRAVRSSIGAYRMIAFNKQFVQDRAEIAGFVRKNRKMLLKLPELPMAHKLLACVISLQAWGRM